MDKKKFGIIILTLVTILILVFSFFEFKRYSNKVAKREESLNISNNENIINNEEDNSFENEEVNDINNNSVEGKENTISENITDSNETNVTNESTDKTEKNETKNETVNNKDIENNTSKNDTKENEKKDEEVKNAITNVTNDSNSNSNNNKANRTSKVIVIDPGHQRKGDNSKEPIGPGATETKAKVTTGATGISTKKLESELNLEVGLLLQTELQKRGYTVIMTRTSQNVNISNSERAKIANEADADAFVRIHADSSTSSSAKGMSVLCQTTKNKYNGNIAIESYNLSKSILDNMVKQTGAKNRGVIRTDTMSGINWATVPTTIIEMGFLSNPEEDKLLSSKDYQNKIVKGIADGIDKFIK